jgi:hypothetical protein
LFPLKWNILDFPEKKKRISLEDVELPESLGIIAALRNPEVVASQ